MPIPEITPQELAEKLQREGREKPVLLDVRTWGEHALVAIPGSRLIPLHELDDRLDELDDVRDREVVVYCHLGVRSISGAAILLDRGFKARSLAGGIDLYSVSVDPALPRY